MDSGGRQIAAAASPDAQEVASGWVLERSTLTVRACRLGGDAGTASVTVTHEPLTGDAAAAKPDAPRLVSVSTPTRADKDRLVALGLDITEHGGRTALGVVLHGAQDERTLRGERLLLARGTFTLNAKRLARGEYRVRFEAGGYRTTLVSRRL